MIFLQPKSPSGHKFKLLGSATSQPDLAAVRNTSALQLNIEQIEKQNSWRTQYQVQLWED
jgi:hypothetical protein